MLPLIILAGGLATRLHPITHSIPKSLVPINGIPFIDYQLDYLRHQNITNIVLCLGHLGEQIQQRVGDGSSYGLNIQYSFDGSSSLGTAGAIKKALPLLSDNFFVQYGDSYLPVNYASIQDAYIRLEKPALMTVFQNHNEREKSNAIYNAGQVLLYNKKNINKSMNFIDYGLSVLNKQIFNTLESDQHFDLADLYEELAIKKLLSGYQVFERYYEIGSHEGISEAERYLLKFKIGKPV